MKILVFVNITPPPFGQCLFPASPGATRTQMQILVFVNITAPPLGQCVSSHISLNAIITQMKILIFVNITPQPLGQCVSSHLSLGATITQNSFTGEPFWFRKQDKVNMFIL